MAAKCRRLASRQPQKLVANLRKRHRKARQIRNGAIFQRCIGGVSTAEVSFFYGLDSSPRPPPQKTDLICRYPNLRLHDQGDKVQLRMSDGTMGKYTVELSQLVFGQHILIMKLAVYELDTEAVDFNSYAISYT